jgi:Clathrin light chain
MDDDDNFFSVEPPTDVPPDAGDVPIMLGEAPDAGGDLFGAPIADDGAPAFMGDFHETENAFAAPPDDGMDGYAADGMGAFASPPGGAIILGEPPSVEDGEDEEATPAVSTGPSPMQIWNDEWQEALLVRKDEENAKKAEFLEAAKVALEKFQKEREMKREAKLSKNREDEQAKLEAIEADLENDNSWQKVCKLVELSHDSKDQAEDVKRMRDAMIFLKNQPATAEVLGA